MRKTRWLKRVAGRPASASKKPTASHPRLEELESRLVPTVPTPDHVVLVIEENHSYSEIIGSSSAPYINSLASQGALMTQSFAIEHPSQPNYLDLFSGSNQGVTNDNTPPPGSPYSTANLGQELIAAGKTFGGYSEDMPSVGYTGSTAGNYARKHNPWVDFSNVPTADNMPFAGFWPTDYSQLPTVSIVVPNLQDDMHDGTIAQGDTWLKNNLDSYVQWAKTHNSLLIVTWDEDDSSMSNQVPTFFVGPMVTPGNYNETINHFSVLRTIEDMYGLSYAGSSASQTPISDIWTSAVTVPAAPSNLTATANGTDQINLTWTDNSSNETSFLIERSTDNVNFTQIASVNADVTSYLNTGLTAGTTYYYRVRAADSAGDSAYSNTANDVARGAAASFSVSAPTSATAGSSFNFTVTAQDSFGHTAVGYTGTVKFASSDGQAVLPANYTFTSSDAGKHTFSATLKTAGSQSLTATDTATSSITGTQSGITVSPAAASTLSVTGFPSPTTAGVAHNFTVTVHDAYGNVATGYTGTVKFSSSDGLAALPGSYAFTSTDAGVHTFSATLKTAGSQSLTATDSTTSTITGTQSGITVNPAAASQLVIHTQPSATATAGVAFATQPVIYEEDQYGNVETGDNSTQVTAALHSGSGPLQGTATATVAAGVATFTNLADNKAETISLDFTSGSLTKATSNNIVVSPAAASTFTVSGFPTAATAGTAYNFTVTAHDAYGNTATGYRGTVKFSSTDGLAALPANYTFTSTDAGVHTFSATLKTAGTQSITVTDTTTSSITGTELGITVSLNVVSSVASTFTVSGFPASITAGASGTITVTAQDSLGHTATGYTGTVSFSSSDGQAVLPANYTFTSADAGVHSFTVTLKTAGTQSITATDTTTSSIKGTQSGITVNPAAASTLSVSGFPTPVTAGTAGNLTVTAQDAYGNTATGYTGTVSITSSDGQAALPANYTFTSADAGKHTFSATLKTAGSQSLTATDTTTSSITGAQSGITVNPAAASVFVLSGVPAQTTQGVAFNVTVTAQDPYGNTATGYAGTVHFSSSDAAATLPANSTLTNGAGTFSVTLNTLGKQTLTATDTVTSTLTASATVPTAPAAPSNLTATAVSTSQINLTWTDNSTGETGFLIERSTDNVNFTQIASVGANATSYSSTGLSRRTKYYYRVRAYFQNPDGSDIYSAYSSTASATTLRKGTSAAALLASSQGSRAQIAWESQWYSFASLTNTMLRVDQVGTV